MRMGTTTDQTVGADSMIYAQKVGNGKLDGENELRQGFLMELLAMSLCL